MMIVREGPQFSTGLMKTWLRETKQDKSLKAGRMLSHKIRQTSREKLVSQMLR